MSKISVTTIAGLTSGGDANKVKIDPSNTLHVPGHAAVGADVVDATRALTVVGASDGAGSSIIVGYNSSLASKFSVRDDGLTTITNNATVGGTLVNTGLITASAGISIGSGGDSNVIDDYEEGTFTPTASTQSSYQFRAGRYVKIGRQVIIQVEMRYVQSGTTHGNIGGFPYAIRETNYLSLFLKEYNSTGHAFHTTISVGNTSTNNFRKVSDNTNTASNGTVYGWGFSLAYETYT